MLTLALQLGNAALALGFAALILWVSRQSPWISAARRHSSLLVGIAFAANGASGLVQGTLAVWAFASGAGDPVYTAFLRFAPAMNQSRTGVEIALALLLSWIAVRGERPLPIWVPLVGFSVGWAIGGMVGFFEEGSSITGRHYSMVALLDTIEMVALLAMLLLALSRSSMDRLIWLTLFIHAIRQSFNAIWFSAFAWIGMPAGWAPRPWTIQAQMAVLGFLMLAIAMRRYQLARRGVHVPSLLEPLMAKQVSSFH